MHVRLSAVLGTATAIVTLVALALGLSSLFRHNGHPVPDAPSGLYPADVDEALWAHVDAAWDRDLAHRTTAILQRRPWGDGEVFLFTYEDNLPEAAGGGRQRVLSWVLVEPDPSRPGWTVAASGNRERVHWPVDQAMPVPADVGVYSFWLSERQDSEGRTMSVIYGLRQQPGYPPDSVELTRGRQAIDIPLENDGFLYVTEGELTPERPGIRWVCDFPKDEWCGVGLFNDEPPARPGPLVFAGEIRNQNWMLDSLTGQFIPFTLGERDVTDPFAPGQLRLPAHVHFSLHWEVVAPPSADWRVFVHLENDAGELALQSDAAVDWPAQPCVGGQYSPECAASSGHEWEFPADFPPGVYTITVGLYDPGTGARAPVTSPPGATPPVKLGHVRVVPDEPAREAAQATLGIFSGRPDPTWMLTLVQETQLRQQLSQLPPTDQPFDDTRWSPSGYHGFTLRLPPTQGQPTSQFVRVYNGVVRVETEGQVVRLADENHALERWLLDTAVGHVEEDAVEIIRQDLEPAPAPKRPGGPPSPAARVPFTVCQSSEAWIRPSEAEQAAQVWDTPRRQGIPREMLWWSYQQSFYRYLGGNSEMFDAWPGLGLWTSKEPYVCKGNRIGDIVTGREIELWVLLHRVVKAQREGNAYTLTVEPISAGYQVVRLPGPGTPDAQSTVRFVDTEGGEIDHLPKLPPWADPDVPTARDVVTVTGTVVDNALSAQVVTLEDADSATWYLPWMDGTIVRWPDGTQAAFRDVTRGMTLVVAGFQCTEAVMPNTLSAVWVDILSAQASSTVATSIRVPAARFNETMDRQASLAVQVTSRNASGQDMTKEDVDLETRLESPETARRRLLGIMRDARTTDELLKAEQQLTQREAEIESLKGRMQYLAQSARLARIWIELQPYVLSQPVGTRWRPAEAARGAVETLTNSLQGLGDFLIFFVIAVLPWTVALGLVVYGVVRLVLWRIRVNRDKHTGSDSG